MRFEKMERWIENEDWGVKHVMVEVVSTDIYRMRRWFAVDASCLLENIERL